jgi:hypothetical protein
MVSAALSRRGRVALVATTAPGYGNRRLRPGSGLGRLRSAYPRRRALGRGLFRASPRSLLLIGVRRGRVRYIAVGSARLLRNRSALRRYLRLAGLCTYSLADPFVTTAGGVAMVSNPRHARADRFC